MPDALPPVTHLLYLHGFRSSPRSAKARLTAAWMARHHPQRTWCCPQLPPSPREAMDLVIDAVAGWPVATMGVIGSSLGGFYATCVAERTGCRAAVLNPAVQPARDLARHIGEQTAWHDPAERFFFEPRFVDELRALQPAGLTRPQRYYALLTKGDEVLDWREMAARYASAHLHVLEGGDHAISDYERHLAGVMGFFGLAAGPR